MYKSVLILLLVCLILIILNIYPKCLPIIAVLLIIYLCTGTNKYTGGSDPLKDTYAYQPSKNKFIDNLEHQKNVKYPVKIIIQDNENKEFYIDEMKYFKERLDIYTEESSLRDPNNLPTKYLYYIPKNNSTYKARARDISNIFANIGEAFDLTRDIFVKVEHLKPILCDSNKTITFEYYGEYETFRFIKMDPTNNKNTCLDIKGPVFGPVIGSE